MILSGDDDLAKKRFNKLPLFVLHIEQIDQFEWAQYAKLDMVSGHLNENGNSYQKSQSVDSTQTRFDFYLNDNQCKQIKYPIVFTTTMEQATTRDETKLTK